MTELVIVLCVIGILMLLVLPNQTGMIERTRELEAHGTLQQIHALQRSNFFRYGKYATDFETIGFEPALTLNEGGQSYYKYEIVESSSNSFKIRATAQTDLDGDGQLNTWEIDHQGLLTKVQGD